MDHFAIVQALCRTAMAVDPVPSPVVRKQIERLRDALQATGDGKQAGALSTLLSSVDRQQEVAPSRITHSRASVSGEPLTPATTSPVDRETGAPLAEIVHPGQVHDEPPILDSTMASAIDSVLDEWRNLEALSAVGEAPSKTCLIYGEPGTGKTHLALWMARRLDLPVVLARIDGLVSSFLGTTSRNIGSLFAFANRHRCLLMLDEFDALAKLRDDPQEVGEIKRVVNALLQNMDSRRQIGLTIGVTNHPRLLDPAVWRRFEIQLEIPLPAFPVRVDIARRFMWPVPAPDSHLRLIAWFAEGASGAEIEALVRTYKKSHAIQAGNDMGLLETLRRFATLNSGRLDPARRSLLFAEPAALFRSLRDDVQLGFSLAEIGEVAGRDKSTVSRQLGGALIARRKVSAADG